MIKESLAQPAHPSTPPKAPSPCAGCGELSGSVSEGTGFPLVRNRRGDGLMYHVRCLPGTRTLDAVFLGARENGRMRRHNWSGAVLFGGTVSFVGFVLGYLAGV